MIKQSWPIKYFDDIRREARTRLAPVVQGFKERHPEEKVEAMIVETAILAVVFAVNVAALLVHFGERIRGFGSEATLD
jgi:hypothetical protein